MNSLDEKKLKRILEISASNGTERYTVVPSNEWDSKNNYEWDKREMTNSSGYIPKTKFQYETFEDNDDFIYYRNSKGDMILFSLGNKVFGDAIRWRRKDYSYNSSTILHIYIDIKKNNKKNLEKLELDTIRELLEDDDLTYGIFKTFAKEFIYWLIKEYHKIIYSIRDSEIDNGGGYRIIDFDDFKKIIDTANLFNL